jgi:magnesium-transporting ATPase (P-type)
MSREDLLDINRKIIETVVAQVVEKSPKAILILVTNPLDTMTYLAYKKSGFPKERVIGMAGILDTARFKAFIAMELGISEEQKRGLSRTQILEKQKIYGDRPNVIPEKRGRTPLRIYLEQFKSPLIYVVLAAGAISFVLKEYNNAYIILVVVILDSFLGFFQEYRAEKAVTALKKLLKATAATASATGLLGLRVLGTKLHQPKQPKVF